MGSKEHLEENDKSNVHERRFKEVTIDEEKEPTIKIQTLDELEDDDFLDTGKEQKETNKQSRKDRFEYLDETKEFKEKIEEDKPDLVVRDLTPDKKPLYMKIAVIATVVIAVIILLVVAILTSSGKKKSEMPTNSSSKETAFQSTINAAVKNGTFDKELKKGLKDSGIEVEKVDLISLDIDSDNDQEVIAYAEEEDRRYILHFEVDDDFYYEDNYQVGSMTSLGYVYSLKDKSTYWYTDLNGIYTIIGYTKLVIKEDDFINDYFAITKEYKKKPFLYNTITYKFNKELNSKELEENKITSKKIYEDNDTTLAKIKEAADEYAKVKEEETAKKEAEEAAQKAAEEEAERLNGTVLKLNNSSLHYGTYLSTKDGTITKVTLNKDKTGTVNDAPCIWKESETDPNFITFACNDKTYDFTSYNNDTLSDSGKIELTYTE